MGTGGKCAAKNGFMKTGVEELASGVSTVR